MASAGSAPVTLRHKPPSPGVSRRSAASPGSGGPLSLPPPLTLPAPLAVPDARLSAIKSGDTAHKRATTRVKALDSAVGKVPDWRVKPQLLLREHPRATVGAAIIIPFLVCAALSPFRDSVTPTTDVLVLVAVVVAFSATGLRAAGLAAALSAAAGFDFFLTEPYRSFAINDANDLEAVALLLVIGGLVTETALWGQRTDAALAREVGYVDGVLATAESVSAEQLGPEEHARRVSQRISEVLDLDSCRFELGATLDPSMPTLNHDGSITRAGRDVDVNRDGLPVDSVVALPVRSGGALRGLFLMTAASHVARPNERQRRVAVLLADQIAATLNQAPR